LDLCLHVQSLAGNAAPLHKMQVKWQNEAV
jgi:hypothetical protein